MGIGDGNREAIGLGAEEDIAVAVGNVMGIGVGIVGTLGNLVGWW